MKRSNSEIQFINMSMAKTLILILIVLVASFGFYLFKVKITNRGSVIERISSTLFDKNQYYINLNGVNGSKVGIQWCDEFGNRKMINEKGVFIDGIGNSYGKNLFIIFYNDKAIDSVGIFKLKNWHVNQYYFTIENDSSNFKCKLITRENSDKNSESR